MRITTALGLVLVLTLPLAAAPPSQEQLARWLKRFPEADTNRDGKLSAKEALAFQQKNRKRRDRPQRGVPRTFKVDPGWNASEFPKQAICHLSPDDIKKANGGQARTFPEPANGILRIVGTGHSFMAPGYKTLPQICRAAGFEQPLHLHTGGGITGSARYKWEQENGIFQFDGRPKPLLLSAIANGKWEAMIWGPYYQDQVKYYSCWIDFCLKYNPQMKFYLSDAWPQVEQLGKIPKSEDVLTAGTITRLGKEKRAIYARLVDELNGKYGNRVFVLPTCDALVLAVQYYHRGKLPGVEGINQAIGKKSRSIWRDRLGHLGPGFDRLEGYVFYATLYGRSPELISGKIRPTRRKRAPRAEVAYPSPKLDAAFRKIAWQAVIHNRQSGVRDENGDGLRD